MIKLRKFGILAGIAMSALAGVVIAPIAAHAYSEVLFANPAGLTKSSPAVTSVSGSHNGGKGWLTGEHGSLRIKTIQGSGVYMTTTGSAGVMLTSHHAYVAKSSRIQCSWVNIPGQVYGTANTKCWRFKS